MSTNKRIPLHKEGGTSLVKSVPTWVRWARKWGTRAQRLAPLARKARQMAPTIGHTIARHTTAPYSMSGRIASARGLMDYPKAIIESGIGVPVPSRFNEWMNLVDRASSNIGQGAELGTVGKELWGGFQGMRKATTLLDKLKAGGTTLKNFVGFTPAVEESAKFLPKGVLGKLGAGAWAIQDAIQAGNQFFRDPKTGRYNLNVASNLKANTDNTVRNAVDTYRNHPIMGTAYNAWAGAENAPGAIIAAGKTMWDTMDAAGRANNSALRYRALTGRNMRPDAAITHDEVVRATAELNRRRAMRGLPPLGARPETPAPSPVPQGKYRRRAPMGSVPATPTPTPTPSPVPVGGKYGRRAPMGVTSNIKPAPRA